VRRKPIPIVDGIGGFTVEVTHPFVDLLFDDNDVGWNHSLDVKRAKELARWILQSVKFIEQKCQSGEEEAKRNG